MISSTKIKRLRFLAFFVLVAFFCTASVAEDSNEPLAPTADKEVLTTLGQQMQKRISIDFRNTPIDDVLRIIAEQANVDIIKSPKVTGNVTATLTNVPLQEALDNILAAHGYSYVAGKNMLRIAPTSEIDEKAERLISKIYRITYADVEEVEKALKKFVSKRGSLSANPGTSHIIITDTESNVKAIDTFISEVDQITPQILVEVRIYDITSRDKLDLGVEWNAGRNTTFGTDGITTIGTNPSNKTDPFITGLFSNPTSKTGSSTSGVLRVGWLNPAIDIDAVLKAQQENTDAKLLANPRIMVLDNETAVFDIVTEHPYVERTIEGSTITETVKFKNVGVNLTVKPHVTREGMIRMHIVPEFGIKVGDVLVQGAAVPIVDTRKADTIALVKDGMTVVLGGLRKKDVSKQINKIPLLGDLPLIGGLFRFEGEDTATTELVVFITPKIIHQPFMSEAEQQAYEVTGFSGPEFNLTRAEKDTD